VFHHEALPGKRFDQPPGKLRVIFDEKNANGYLPAELNPTRNSDASERRAPIQVVFSLAAASRQFYVRYSPHSNGTFVVPVGTTGDDNEI
jgi:hypothetical protein